MQDWKESEMGYLYLFFLVLIDKILEGSNHQLHQYLESLKTNATERFRFEHFSEEGKIRELLCIGGKKSIEKKIV